MTQVAEAAFPDDGSCGVRLIVDDDLRGVYQSVALDHEAVAQTVRLAVCPTGLVAGRVAVLAARDDSGSVWWLEVDADDRQYVLRERGGDALSWSWSRGPAWSVVAIRVEIDTGMISLSVNGLAVGALESVGVGGLVALDLGVLWRSGDASGGVDLDMLMLSGRELGVPVPACDCSSLADPRRWAVLYRVDDPDSVLWADAYRARRGIPYANLIPIETVSDECVDASGYAWILSQFTNYLTRHQLRKRITGVLLGFGMPGYLELQPGGYRLPLSSLLASDASDFASITNPLYRSDASGVDQLQGLRLGARIDGATLAEAMARIDRADAVMAGSLRDAGRARLYIDTDGPLAGGSDVIRDRHRACAESSSVVETRMSLATGAVDGVRDDGIVWLGLNDALPDGFFGDVAGPRALLCQLSYGVIALDSVREARPGSVWGRSALDAGYAAVGGASGIISPAVVPDLGIVMDRLVRGWTLAGSWHAAMPHLRTAVHLIGDPLMRVPMALHGWDLVLPQGDGVGRKLAGIRESERAFEVPEMSEEETARLVVVPRDRQGDVCDGVRGIRLIRQGGAVSMAGCSWVWPTRPGWSLKQDGRGLCSEMIWPCTLRSAGVAAAMLEMDSGDGVSSLRLSVEPVQRRLRIEVPIPGVRTRYRVIVSDGRGVSRSGPWSAWWEPSPETFTLSLDGGVA